MSKELDPPLGGMVYNTIVNPQNGEKAISRQFLSTTQSCWEKRPRYGETATGTFEHVLGPVLAPVGEERFYVPHSVVKTRFPLRGQDKDSFKKIVRSRRIKMSHYTASTVTTTNLLHRVRENKREAYQHALWWGWHSGGEICDPQCGFTKNLVSHATWDEQGDFAYWAESAGHHYKAPPVNIDREVMAAMSKSVSDALNTYDLFTDLYETKSSLRVVLDLLGKVRRPLESFKKAREVLKSKGATHAAITKLWMQYRYGIMPIMYSIEDAMKNLDDSIHTYKTSRAQRDVDLYYNGTPSWSPSKVTLFDIVEGTTKIRATGKGRFTSLAHRLIDQTGFNSITSLWEVTPYSLVVDWFSNVGEWLHIHTAAMASFAEERNFCYSIKTTKRTNTYVRVIPDTIPEFHQPSRQALPGTMVHPAWTLPEVKFSPSVGLLRVVEEESYHRFVFTPSDVTLTLDVQFSNWKRWADGYVMSLKPILGALRRL